MDVKGKKIHFIGIGGIGMSSIAEIAVQRGAVVSGCDLRENGLTAKLREAGCKCYLGHSPEHIAKQEIVVYSSAIPRQNAELSAAIASGAEVISRATMLSRLMEEKKSIAIAGAHGKTTTTWMTSHLLINAGFDPTVMVGGNVPNILGNFRVGDGDWFVTEVDESDGLLTEIKALYSIITNIDLEHLDFYKDIEQIKDYFAIYIENTLGDGCIIAGNDNPHIADLMSRTKKRVITYGVKGTTEVVAKEIALNPMSSEYDYQLHGHVHGRIRLEMPGMHNLENSLAAVTLGMELGIDFDVIREAIGSCRSVKRRFEVRGEKGGVRVVDDYGHHPTEVKATITAAKNALNGHGKLIAVFQPHRYSRTKCLRREFGFAFDNADAVVVSNIYTANEDPIEGITGETIVDEIRKHSVVPVEYIPKRGRILDYLFSVVKPGDTVLLLGAGDIGELADAILERL